MPSPWLAIGRETDPLSRARQLQRSWERLLADGVLDSELPPDATAGLRPAIVDSWRRSLASGLDPTELAVPVEADQSALRERWREHPLGSLGHVLAAHLGQIAEESHSLVVVSDASGLLLRIDGAESLKERAAEMNFVEGAVLSESVDGTNGIGTPFAADHPLQVFASEHFNRSHHQWVCSGAPVHDPVSGQIVGLIDLSSLWKVAHPRSLELVTTAARKMERCLLDNRRDQDARLRRRYSDLMTSSTDLLVNRNGYVLDGDERGHPTSIEIPEGGGEVVVGDGSVAVAEALGHGEAYLVRRTGSRGARSERVGALKRAERRARELASEQAALRQVATLVAGETSPDHLLTVVATQAARIFDVPLVKLVRYQHDSSVAVGGFGEGIDDPFPVGSRWPLDSPGVISSVRESGRPARMQDYARMPGAVAAVLRRSGVRSAVASPIVVEGRLWGALAIASPRREALPEDTEARLTDFAELVAMAIANAESRAAVGRLADEQAALRRVAELVARQAPPEEVFGLVTEELNRLLDVTNVATARFGADGTATIMAVRGTAEDAFPPGKSVPLAGGSAIEQVFRTGRPAHLESYDNVDGEIGIVMRELGAQWSAGGPIVVDGELWGAMVVGSSSGALYPTGAEERVAQFAELVSTAISNIESRARVEQLAAEQAALRRVAELVARQASSEEVFSLVTQELCKLLEVDMMRTVRFEPDGSATVLAAHGMAEDLIPPGTTNIVLPSGTVIAQVFRTGRPARVDDYADVPGPIGDLLSEEGARSGAGGPIIVDGRLWGAMAVGSQTVLPTGTEDRVAQFAELVSTAISNIESRAKVERLAAEQSALRRVATLVAREYSPEDLFATLAEELGVLLQVDATAILRYEADSSATVVAGWSDGAVTLPLGERFPLEGENLAGEVHHTGSPRRKEDYSGAPGVIAATVRELGIRSAVASPIVVEGMTWGVIAVLSRQPEALPVDTEARIAEFTRQAGLAVVNAKSRGDLAESRARIVRAGDEARRRFERDLHDGAQQRLVSLGLELRSAEATVPPGLGDLRGRLSRLGTGLNDVLEDLRELSRGLHPAVLSEGGLGAALSALALRSSVPVELHLEIGAERFDEPVEVTAYYVASEALTNTAKHAQASRVEVRSSHRGGWLEVIVSDDGRGGADGSVGSGLTGLVDRVEAIGGAIHIDSRAGRGTAVHVKLPTRSTPC
jgi:GAF domain-containing protein